MPPPRSLGRRRARVDRHRRERARVAHRARPHDRRGRGIRRCLRQHRRQRDRRLPDWRPLAPVVEPDRVRLAFGGATAGARPPSSVLPPGHAGDRRCHRAERLCLRPPCGDRDERNGGRNQSMQRGGWGDDEQGHGNPGRGPQGPGPEGHEPDAQPDGPQPDAQPAGRPPDGSTLPGAGRSGALAGPGNVPTARSSGWHEHPDRALPGWRGHRVHRGPVTDRQERGRFHGDLRRRDRRHRRCDERPTVGATVRVIADKDGAKATRVQVLQAGATN